MYVCECLCEGVFKRTYADALPRLGACPPPWCLPRWQPSDARAPPAAAPCAYLPAEAQRREVRPLLLNRSKVLLAPASTAYKHSIK